MTGGVGVNSITVTEPECSFNYFTKHEKFRNDPIFTLATLIIKEDKY